MKLTSRIAIGAGVVVCAMAAIYGYAYNKYPPGYDNAPIVVDAVPATPAPAASAPATPAPAASTPGSTAPPAAPSTSTPATRSVRRANRGSLVSRAAREAR